VQRLRPELWQQVNWLLHQDNAPYHTSLLTKAFLTETNMTVFSHRPYFSLFPRLKTKLKDRNFDIIQVIEAESFK
jgi:hypothetical protein